MEDDSPVIYGLEFNARALCPQHAEADVIRFLVGSQSLRFENQVHLIDFDDESNIINKNVFMHSVGEIWSINSSPVDKNILSTCYNKVSDNKAEIKAGIWRIPPVDETEPPPPDSPGLSHSSGGGYTRPLQLVCELDNQNENMKSVLWNPSGNGSQVISVSEQHLNLWDINTSTAILESVDSANLVGKGQPKFTTGRWNPHHGGSQLATTNDTTIRGWDSRTLRQVYMIENAHGQLVRDIDFNPNKQYYMVSCGDDCKIKFWDTRKIDEPLMVVSEHSHWVWSIRYNHFHDQLLLSSSSDSRVILHNIISLSSEPFGHLDNEEDEEDKIEKTSKDPATDGVIATFDEHEDSVYASEWSTADPWVFASLSYDGRLVINRVPRAEKYKILL
ncbi:EARP and GARP complex-interacting protein 1-like [Actinia tenebrosa]|uniref:EARP and GARP complex-interacting protein 1-like n=1 Tax=Actinia tenebrosa TaxID=6105 RepID=A0A6P8HG03_ACTTE|nr:EARP and GARP complex-interacting protein 1-like [Actinia tenebrosa]